MNNDNTKIEIKVSVKLAEGQEETSDKFDVFILHTDSEFECYLKAIESIDDTSFNDSGTPECGFLENAE